MINNNNSDETGAKYFQFTLGPVQGFVAQARRTRDFWAGSFILSWLSAVAIKTIETYGGQVTFPIPDENYMGWLEGKGKNSPPQQGGIPNRFKALTAKVPEDFNPNIITQTVQLAWEKLANSVWIADLEKISTKETREIWNRQIKNFWEMSWVMSNDDSANLLDRRKNWRTSIQPEEPGHKCMMMDGWQELSGITAVNLKKVDAFWMKLREQDISGISNDIREGERLCAMAFIKRRFANYFDQICLELDAPDNSMGIKIKGWRLPKSIPSVSFLAAAPWLEQAIRYLPVSTFAQFYNVASTLVDKTHNEIAHTHENTDGFTLDIKQISESIKSRQSEKFERKFAGLDGTVYFETELENIRNFSAPNSLTELRTKKQMSEVIKELRKMSQLMQEQDLQKSPSPYYAIVLMDGDQLGKHMGDVDKQVAISNALNQFTQQVPKTVYDYNGFLIYAGGDDVLALFPMDYALSAAAALQKEYLKVFANNLPKNNKPKIESTLSGAIEFVHIRTPLTQVLRDAHRLLDDVAKEEVGRNALAVRVWKPSGLAIQWAMPWEKVLGSADQMSDDAVVLIEALAKDFNSLNDNTSDFSNKFFFRAKQVVERLGNNIDEDDLIQILMSEWRHSYGDYNTKLDEDKFHRLISQSWVWRRSAPGQPPSKSNSKQFNPDTALLIRFLAQKGLGSDD